MAPAVSSDAVGLGFRTAADGAVALGGREELAIAA